MADQARRVVVGYGAWRVAFSCSHLRRVRPVCALNRFVSYVLMQAFSLPPKLWLSRPALRVRIEVNELS